MNNMRMTVKQIAELAGCSVSCVSKYSNTLYPGMKTGHGRKKYFNQEQATEIMKVIPVKNSDLVISCEDSEVRKVEIRTSELSEPIKQSADFVSAIKEMQTQNQAFMLKIVEMLKPGSTQPAQVEIEAPVKRIAPAPEMTSRAKINRIVQSHCERNQVPYSDAWGQLYASHRYRTGKNFKLRAKNRSITPLDLFEIEDEIRVLLSIAVEMWGA